jgi:ribonuclease HI
MERLTIYTHGVCNEDLGPAAIGVYVVDVKEEVVLSLSESIGNGTNDYAEYFAVVRALQEVKKKFGDQTTNMEFELKSSNDLVINNLSAKEQLNNVSLVGHFMEIFNMRVASFPHLQPTLIKPDLNKEATNLAQDNLDV